MNPQDMQKLTPAAFEFRLGDTSGPRGIDRDDYSNWFFVSAVPMTYSNVHQPDVYDRHQQVVTTQHTSLAVMWARKWRPWRDCYETDCWFSYVNCEICGKHTHQQGETGFMRDHPDRWAHVECAEKVDGQ